MKRALMILSIAALAFGCGDDDPVTPTPGTDAGNGGIDGGPPAMDDAGITMDAGGPTPDPFVFRDDAPTAYTRVDRMGAPAVSTALVTSDNKNDYNDGDPTNDVSGDAPGRWAGEFIGVLDGFHTALNSQLEGAGLTPCDDGTDCATQPIAEGAPIVASFVIPDVLTINTTGTAGFPNGRQLADPVMDVILALVLLDMETHTPTTFVEMPLNPTANDVAFGDEFPWVAAPHTP